MRTTVDLPEDIHQLVRQVAHDRRESLGEVLTELIRAGIAAKAGSVDDLDVDPMTGLLVMRGTGLPITTEDVRSLDDDG